MKRKRTTTAELLEWADSAGPETLQAFQYQLSTRKPSAYSFCIEVQELGLQYGSDAVESACSLFHRHGGRASLKMIRRYITGKTLFPMMLDELAEDVHITPGITRGMEHFLNAETTKGVQHE